MDSLTPSNTFGQGGLKENQYMKTTEYQVVKVLRGIFRLLAIATAAIIILVKDVIKGLFGR
jgi:hypothetical protein